MGLRNFLRAKYYKFKSRNLELSPQGQYFFQYLKEQKAGSDERIERHEDFIAHMQTIQNRTREEMIDVLLAIHNVIGK